MKWNEIERKSLKYERAWYIATGIGVVAAICSKCYQVLSTLPKLGIKHRKYVVQAAKI